MRDRHREAAPATLTIRLDVLNEALLWQPPGSAALPIASASRRIELIPMVAAIDIIAASDLVFSVFRRACCEDPVPGMPPKVLKYDSRRRSIVSTNFAGKHPARSADLARSSPRPDQPGRGNRQPSAGLSAVKFRARGPDDATEKRALPAGILSHLAAGQMGEVPTSCASATVGGWSASPASTASRLAVDFINTGDRRRETLHDIQRLADAGLGKVVV